MIDSNVKEDVMKYSQMNDQQLEYKKAGEQGCWLFLVLGLLSFIAVLIAYFFVDIHYSALIITGVICVFIAMFLMLVARWTIDEIEISEDKIYILRKGKVVKTFVINESKAVLSTIFCYNAHPRGKYKCLYLLKNNAPLYVDAEFDEFRRDPDVEVITNLELIKVIEQHFPQYIKNKE